MVFPSEKLKEIGYDLIMPDRCFRCKNVAYQKTNNEKRVEYYCCKHGIVVDEYGICKDWEPYKIC